MGNHKKIDFNYKTNHLAKESENKPTRFYSNNQEKSVANAINGKRQSNSGATPFAKGDVKNDEFLLECKIKTKSSNSFSIKKEWIEKNKDEAMFMGKSHTALVFSFGPDEPNYYIIDENEFKEYVELIKDERV